MAQEDKKTVAITSLQMHALVWTRSVDDLAKNLFGVSGNWLAQLLDGWGIAVPTIADRLRLYSKFEIAYPALSEDAKQEVIEAKILARCDLETELADARVAATLLAIQRGERTELSRAHLHGLVWSMPLKELKALLSMNQRTYEMIFLGSDIPVPPRDYFLRDGQIAPGSKRDALPDGPEGVVYVAPGLLQLDHLIRPAPLRVTSIRDELGPDASRLIELWLTSDRPPDTSQESIMRGFQALGMVTAEIGPILRTLLSLPPPSTMWNRWKDGLVVEHISYASVRAMIELKEFVAASTSQFVLDGLSWARTNPTALLKPQKFQRKPRTSQGSAKLGRLASAGLPTGTLEEVPVDCAAEDIVVPVDNPEAIEVGAPVRPSCAPLVPSVTAPVEALLDFMSQTSKSGAWMDTRDRAIFELMVGCKMSPRAIVYLRSENIDWAIGRLEFFPRDGLRRTSDIPERTMAALHWYNRHRPESNSGPYFVGENGTQLRRQSVNEIIDRRCRMMGMTEPLSPTNLNRG